MKTVSPVLSSPAPNLKITDVECHVLLAPDYDPSFTSSAQDSLVVLIHTDGGVTGIGECDANPWMAKAVIEAPGTHTMGQAIKEILIGADPFRIGDLWEQIYTGTAMNGRRGMVIHAMSAIDMALWDLCGKAMGQPVHALLGGATRQSVTPYASLQPAGHSFEEYRDALVQSALDAKALGFTAMKSEVTMNGPYAHSGMREPFEKHTEVVAAVRKAVGPEITLMVDVQYLWDDADACLATVKDWAEFDLYFLETPITADNVEALAKVSEQAPTMVASGEWLATRYEFKELMDIGKVQVAQPDVGRVGGIGEAKIVCDMAAERGLKIVPHCWKTGISISATAHLAFVTNHCSFIEYLPPQLCVERLRRELAQEELHLVDGALSLPEKPGLGVELDYDVMRKFTVA
ncbi:mandelate racemase/muconate lactonizing enzyme family protein [Frigidibacter sp. ROC022]|uniref:mandelate racemase/muconate lactonizing enzyme family protein n=1 Tax=Frigidibacter sp. ROC022 TaxID=2971796 RepID=UPI00215AA56C|nr:mandelate racemase/muconate lactonizing enzyme family protein [Frigidibacter sp. ROC022]MCR8725389.1 mandelate racemase/muconate lactonizing enzyme family protein [Frigidibacter sp. ROC022]